MSNGRPDIPSGNKRRWGFRLAAVLIPVVLVLGAEGGLRLTWTEEAPAPSTPGGWGKGALVVTPHTRQQLLEQVRDAAGKVTAVRTSRRMVNDHFMHDLSWSTRPAPGTFRVFCFGGSATHGVPFEKKKGVPFPDRLQAHLRAAGKNAEVFNLGGASFGSDQVLELVKEVLEYGPSALVVYSANNEFFNYHLELVALNRSWVPRRLEKIKLLAVARKLLGRSDETAAAPQKDEPRDDRPGPEPRKDEPRKDEPRRDEPRKNEPRKDEPRKDEPRRDEPRKDEPGGSEQDAHVRRQEKLVADIMTDTLARAKDPVRKNGERFERADAHHLSVVRRYEANLAAMVDMAAKKNVTLVIVKVPANLMARPTLSLHHPDLGSAAAFDEAMVRGQKADRARQPRVAIKAFGLALETDPWFALAHYQRGRARLNSKDAARAVVDLRNALELDMNPGRPVAAMDRVVGRVTGKGKALMVDLEPAFGTTADPSRCRDYFHDTCHLTARGYDVLGQEVARVLVKEE